MNRFNFYPGDWFRDTCDLTPHEEGIYLRLLLWYYSNEKPIPESRGILISRAITGADQKITNWVLSRFFNKRVVDGEVYYHHKKCDKEITNWVLSRKRAKENGKKGGRPPGIKTKEKPKTEAKQNLEQKLPPPPPPPPPIPDPNPPPDIKNKTKKAAKGSAAVIDKKYIDIAEKFLSIFNAVFGRRCRNETATAIKVKSRLEEGIFKEWQILCMPIIQFSADPNTGKSVDNFAPEMLLRDGKHKRTGENGKTYGATDWLDRAYGQADTLRLDARLTAIAAHYGLIDDIKRTGCEVTGDGRNEGV